MTFSVKSATEIARTVNPNTLLTAKVKPVKMAKGKNGKNRSHPYGGIGT